ncbi:general substrate transporter [Aspergillus cavernicola]|uniref:General substrate transporter n=1 Tax=Aspergillus cavernicola TaxID=176166 RepID=A0ABR4IUH0_9EURO
MNFLTNLWKPHVAKSSKVIIGMLMACATITSSTIGFDTSMMNGLNILPSYTEYFQITNTTKGLSTSATYIGGILAALSFPHFVEHLSRRTALLLAATVTLLFIVLQTASQNIAMFVVSRIGLGYGKSCTTIVAPTYLAETLPHKYRGWGLGLINDFYYVGALVAAGVTYRTADFNSTWAWRLPSLLQGFWSILCICILPFVPESPRWLISHGRNEEALQVLAQVNSNGDDSDPLVLAQHREIINTIRHDNSTMGNMSFTEIIRNRSVIKRLSLVFSCSLGTVVVGSQIASYYFGTMLDNAGITDTTTQLQINIILNAWCLLCGLFGTYLADIIGRRTSALLSTILLTIFLYLIGVFVKLYGHSSDKSGIYATVAFMFLFMGSYSLGWTPLTYLYPPEVLNYAIRAQGMGLNNWTFYSFGLTLTFAFPFALDAMGWKAYIMNASWNVLLIVFIYFKWVETKGKTLEEIDAAFDDVEYTDGLSMDQLEAGKVDLKELPAEVLEKEDH